MASKINNLTELMDFRPHFKMIETPEPSLRDILFQYYQPHVGTLKAGELTDAYIALVREEMAR